jgi:uncharacterized protein
LEHSLSERLKKERHCGDGMLDIKNKTLYIENIPFLYGLFKKMLHLSGIYEKWHKNALSLKIRHENWDFYNLPESFDGFKILQLSDLHLDGLPELAEILPALMRKVKYDLCVFTGDYRYNIHSGKEQILHLIETIISQANLASYPALGILGNHDYLQYTEDNVAAAGLKILYNETIQLQRESDKILIAGLDDVHFYRSGRLFDLRKRFTKEIFKILLVHSPEYFREAALSRFDLYLCGHTHGGQLCLPGEIPLISNSRSPFKFMRGRWKYKYLQGYTSRGAGTSGLPLRLNCAGEITIHHLRRKN